MTSQFCARDSEVVPFSNCVLQGLSVLAQRTISDRSLPSPCSRTALSSWHKVLPHISSVRLCLSEETKTEGKTLILQKIQTCLPREAFLTSLHQPFHQQELLWCETLPPLPFALRETPPEPLSTMLPLFPSALHPALSWLLSIFCMTAIESTDGTRELLGGSERQLPKAH